MDVISPQRKFLHDLATPLAGLKLILNRIHRELTSDSPTLSGPEITVRIEKALELLKKMEELHASKKAEL